MVNEHLRRQALQDPDMLESLVWSQPLVRVPTETSLDEISKVGILVADDQTEWLAEGFS